jgi:cytoskeletal protein RodZ
MKKLNESGFAHFQLVAGALLVIGVVSFAAYRVGQNQTNNQQVSETKQPETVQEIKVSEQDEQKEVAIPEEVKEAPAAPVEEKKTTKTETTTTEKKKSEKTYLKMTKVSAVQNGSVIDVVSKLPQPLSGTCNFKLWQNGYEKVYSSVTITNSSDCVGQLNVANLPVYTGWSLHAWFDSSDGKTSASQAEEAISIQQP